MRRAAPDLGQGTVADWIQRPGDPPTLPTVNAFQPKSVPDFFAGSSALRSPVGRRQRVRLSDLGHRRGRPGCRGRPVGRCRPSWPSRAGPRRIPRPANSTFRQPPVHSSRCPSALHQRLRRPHSVGRHRHAHAAQRGGAGDRGPAVQRRRGGGLHHHRERKGERVPATIDWGDGTSSAESSPETSRPASACSAATSTRRLVPGA